MESRLQLLSLSTILLTTPAVILASMALALLPTHENFLVYAITILCSILLAIFLEYPVLVKVASRRISTAAARLYDSVPLDWKALLLVILFHITALILFPRSPVAVYIASFIVYEGALAVVLNEYYHDDLQICDRAGAAAARAVRENTSVAWRHASRAAVSWYGSARAKAAAFFHDTVRPAISAFGRAASGSVNCSAGFNVSRGAGSFSFQFAVGSGEAVQTTSRRGQIPSTEAKLEGS